MLEQHRSCITYKNNISDAAIHYADVSPGGLMGLPTFDIHPFNIFGDLMQQECFQIE